MDERDVIKRLRQGDISGLAYLVQTYQYEAVRVATLITRDRGAAEDIVQSAFVRTFERIGQFDPDRPFRPWFLQIVINDAVKMAQRRQRYQSWDAMRDRHSIDLCGGELSPEDQLLHAETIEAIQQAMSRLSPLQRASIVQRYYLGLSEREMACLASVSPGTIKSRLHNARIHLLNLLSSERSNPERPPNQRRV